MPPKRVHDFAFRVDDHSDVVVESREPLYYSTYVPVCYPSRLSSYARGLS
jgi:hypothetical protein